MPRLTKLLQRLAVLLFAAILLLYPLIVYLGLSYFDVKLLAVVLLAIFIGRIAVSGKTTAIMPASYVMVLALAGMAICTISLLSKNHELFKLYPIIVNIAFAAIFALSIMRPPTVIERIARLENPDLSPAGVRYTGNVTAVWLGFFILNGMISAYTAVYADLRIWTLYNGLISYLLMAVLFACEYLFRIRVKQREKTRSA